MMKPPLASFFGLRSCNLICFLVFFFLSCISVLLRWIVCCCVCLSDTEQQMMPAFDVLFWNQVIETNQFFFPALRPLIC
jgi:hypothetical protein